MTRPGRRTARLAYDPRVVVAFLDAHSVTRIDGVPRRRRHYINGIAVPMHNEARVIRRWRNHAEGATVAGVRRLLTFFGLTELQLAAWAGEHDLPVLLRGHPYNPPEST